jgi:hydroxyacylglutathione hydrolase
MSDHGEAFVVDPRRDVDEYIDLAVEDCAKIKYIFETHRNEDYVVGSLELKDKTGGEICHSFATEYGYGDHSLRDGDGFRVGRLRVESLWTPGHTINSMCYVVFDTRNSGVPHLVFTGDTLFVGDVGRTDLSGDDVWEEMSQRLFESLHEKVLTLGDDVAIFPAHTAGSICGSKISDREISTIGYEKRTNPLLSLSREEFVKDRLENEMPRPRYFRRMEKWNLEGAPLLKDVKAPELLEPKAFAEKLSDEKALIIDTRQPDAYAGSHIPDSISVWMDGSAYYTGLIIPFDKNILLVCERVEDVSTVVTYLRRIGYDNVIGYLCLGIDAWRNEGYLAESLTPMHVEELNRRLIEGSVHLLDIRERYEWDEGHVRNSQHIFLGELQDRLDELPRDVLVCTTCGWGGRGGIAASILKRNGFKVANLLGGIHAWESRNLPLVNSSS